LKKEKWALRHKAIENIIDRRLVYAQFKKRKYRLPESIVERMLDGLARSLANGDRKLLEKKARDAGLTMNDLREQAKERAASSLLINERCSKSVYITPKQVYDYYVEHRDEFTVPARLKLQAILLKCGKGDSAVARFAERLKKTLAGADEKKFADYASLYSQGPNHKNGGKVGWIPESDLRPEFAKILTGAKAGSIYGPVRTPEGLYFIRVMNREEANAKSFDSVKADIRKKLTDAAKKMKYKKYSDSLRKFAVIRFFDKQVAAKLEKKQAPHSDR
jgi:peptidyl-prolyl cis-trans isomerase SurA